MSRALDPIEVRLVPAADPPHRDAPAAGAGDRVAMLEIAIREFPALAIDPREIARPGKSYTVDTLSEIRTAMPARPVALVVGADAFLGLPRWHRWRELFALAHVIVVPRPGVRLDAGLAEPLATEWRLRETPAPDALRSRPAGSIYVQPVAAHPISSTAIRAAVARGDVQSVEAAGLLPPAVLAYIESKHLYRPTRTPPPNAR